MFFPSNYSSFLIIQIGQAFAYHEQYRLPLPSELEHQPSYAIRIPFDVGQTDYSPGYDPSQVVFPAGMTVVW